jgi:hypothetical protein
LCTVQSGLVFFLFLQCFHPGFHDYNLAPRLYDFDQYELGSLYTKVLMTLIAISSVAGVLRLPKNSIRLRKLYFTQSGLYNLLLFVIGDSNIGLLDSNIATFDLFTLPGQIVFFVVVFAYIAVNGELVAEAIGGPSRGRNKVPLAENRVAYGLATAFGFFPFYLTLKLFFQHLPMLLTPTPTTIYSCLGSTKHTGLRRRQTLLLVQASGLFRSGRPFCLKAKLRNNRILCLFFWGSFYSAPGTTP